MTLLNLCVLLPAVVLTHYVRGIVLAMLSGAREWSVIHPQLTPMPFPLAVWRVDSVMLILLGLLLVPISLGRWSIRRSEGGALVLLYAAYLVMATILGVRG